MRHSPLDNSIQTENRTTRQRYQSLRLLAGYLGIVIHFVLNAQLAYYYGMEREIRLILMLFGVSVFQVVAILPVVILGGWGRRLLALPVLIIGGIGLYFSLSISTAKYI